MYFYLLKSILVFYIFLNMVHFLQVFLSITIELYNFLIIFCMFSISMISYDSFYIYINILSKLANDLSTILVIQWANFYFLFIKYIFEKMKSSHNFTFQRKITWICYHFSKYPFKCLLIRDALKIFHMKIELYSALLCNFKNV